MKRSQVVQLLAGWAKPEILQDQFANNHEEWADNLLYTLENEYKFKIVDDDDYIACYEPEEGYEEYFRQQDLKDEARDFELIVKRETTGTEIAKLFLQGKSFEELSQQYNVTRERVRQIVGKYRRIYQRQVSGENNEKK